ncbi:putative protein kinase RLK-Pelle-LRR-XI-1 family [Helianthus annuus]|nr:putative protein kinase RLK-Pelle-LRR-XI-1 family [Helianthus annuus]
MSSAEILPKERTRWPEYEAEVAALSSLRHMNVVKLYCCISSEDSNLLVYEYMPNGSLLDRLHTNNISMDWSVRYDIGIGVAMGIQYLHHGCERPVLHRDVKSKNILLDEEMKPKLAGFRFGKDRAKWKGHGIQPISLQEHMVTLLRVNCYTLTLLPRLKRFILIFI